MTKPHAQTCPVATFLNIFGDAWTWLIVREAFYGATRFGEFQRNTGAAKNLLSERLNKLVAEGFLERKDMGTSGPRYEYFLTEKGKSLIPVLATMVQWSNEHIHGEGGEPVFLIDGKHNQLLPKIGALGTDGREMKWGDILVRVGPGSNRLARERVEASPFHEGKKKLPKRVQPSN
ncbi:winged helix-turn-helix transcriptional regulator [Ruegeria jejuensis]|uniref:winged helix-turn-helix transcriptional regulator n=1 Tax=Ruegeria jejuensis TaxID=3233338 RepID=UPI00355AD0DD